MLESSSNRRIVGGYVDVREEGSDFKAASLVLCAFLAAISAAKPTLISSVFQPKSRAMAKVMSGCIPLSSASL